MWPITLMTGMLFGVALDEKKASFEKWLLAVVATIVIGIVAEFMLPPLVPALSSLALSSDAMILTHVEVALGGVIFGFIVSRVKKAIIE